MEKAFQNIFKIIGLAEKLKCELRHSWLSNGRQESVAEHTWRLSLMAMLIEPHLPEKLNMERLLKMIVIHDIAEAEAGDIPAFHTMNDHALKQQKTLNEQKAIENIKAILGPGLGDEFYALWHEFEEKKTYEAKVANALDKLEAQIQHNEADLATWLDIEHQMSFMMDRHVAFEPVLQKFKDMIEQQAEEKLKQAGIHVEDLKKQVKAGK